MKVVHTLEDVVVKKLDEDLIQEIVKKNLNEKV